MNVKKLLALLTAGAIALSLTACGKSDSPAPTEENESPAAASAEKDAPAAPEETSAPEEGVPQETPAPVQITMEEVLAANSGDALWERCGSAQCGSENSFVYIEPEIYYTRSPWGWNIYTPTFSYAEDTEGPHVSLDSKTLWGTDIFISLLGELTRKEEILSAEEAGGVLTVRTSLPAEDLTDYGNVEGLERVECLYTLDAETLALLAFDGSYSWKDGTTETEHFTVSYDESRPEEVTELLERAEDPENLRTVTIVIDPGTQAEARFSVTTFKGVDVYNDITGDAQPYWDSNCTVPYEGGADTNEDITFYFRSEGSEAAGEESAVYVTLDGESFQTCPYAGENTPEGLLAGLSQLTGWDLSLADEISAGKGGITVVFADGCSLFSGPPEEQKDEFHVYDATQLTVALLGSVQRTLQMWAAPDHPDGVDIYFAMTGDEPLALDNLGVVWPSLEIPYSMDTLLGLIR